jgi:5-methylcytosine-specific restriction enzyme A
VNKWNDSENAAIVAAYNQMQATANAALFLNKSAVRRALMAGPLASRSNGSIELKFMNISACRASLGLPILKGYIPAGNYSKDLLEEVAKQSNAIAA